MPMTIIEKKTLMIKINVMTIIIKIIISNAI